MPASFPCKTLAGKGFQKARVSGYFRHTIRVYQAGKAPCIFLPSLMELSKLLGCSALEIQAALQGLRRNGFDYFSIDSYHPITFWMASRIMLADEP